MLIHNEVIQYDKDAICSNGVRVHIKMSIKTVRDNCNRQKYFQLKGYGDLFWRGNLLIAFESNKCRQIFDPEQKAL